MLEEPPKGLDGALLLSPPNKFFGLSEEPNDAIDGCEAPKVGIEIFSDVAPKLKGVDDGLGEITPNPPPPAVDVEVSVLVPKSEGGFVLVLLPNVNTLLFPLLPVVVVVVVVLAGGLKVIPLVSCLGVPDVVPKVNTLELVLLPLLLLTPN